MESRESWPKAMTLVVLLTAAAEVNMLHDPAREHHLKASVGGHVAFNCYLNFPFGIEHPYELYWKKDEQVIYSYANDQLMSADTYAGRITWLSTGKDGWGRGSINLTAIRETDNGWYQCKVVFPNRMPTTRNNGTLFHLEVDGGNLIATPPVNSSVMEGHVITLDCISKQPDSFVKWYKDDEPIVDLPDLSHRSELLNDGSMLINPTVMSDMGWYECVIANSKGDRQSARAYLNVTYKAKVIYAPPKIYLPYGQSALLDCHFRANPPLTNLRWEKDGFLFDSYNVRGVFYRKNGSLYFDRVDESHKGHYTCTPFNSLGTEGPSPLIQVYVQHPPKFSRTPPPLQLARAGSTVQLVCEAHEPESGHVPGLQWSRQDNSPLPEGRYFIQGGNLTIESVMASDAGVYECAASNQAATVTAPAELVVEGAASRAPYNLTAYATDTSVLVRWMPGIAPSDNLPHNFTGYSRSYMEYNVWYRPVEVSEWRTMRILSKKTTEATINQLLPGTEYEIMVLCEDKSGDGMFSKAIRVRTKSQDDRDANDNDADRYTELGAPRDVSVRAIDEGLLVTWAPPAHGRELLRTYVVRWHRADDQYLLGSAETSNHYLLVHGLDENQTYSFQVFSMSTQDYQTASGEVKFRVPAHARTAALIATAAGVAVLLAICSVAIYYARNFMSKLCCSVKETTRKQYTNRKI